MVQEEEEGMDMEEDALLHVPEVLTVKSAKTNLTLDLVNV